MTKSTGQRRTFPRSMTLEQRFDALVPERPAEGCWDWAGSVQKGGYGQITVGGRTDQVVHLAHRLAHETHIGPIPAGFDVEHVCENKRCVRWTPDPALDGQVHIAAVTHKQNMARSQPRLGWGEYQRRRKAAG